MPASAQMSSRFRTHPIWAKGIGLRNGQFVDRKAFDNMKSDLYDIIE
jgi:hypothetical protein